VFRPDLEYGERAKKKKLKTLLLKYEERRPTRCNN
jgi:hypothetical protein